MKINKIVVLLLLTAIIAVPLLSCGGNENSDNTTTTTAGSIESENNQTAETLEDDAERTASDIEPKPAYPELPVQDLGGYNYRVISRSYASIAHWYNHDISAEEETGDSINDAVYARNKAIEERYNINIVNMPSDNVATSVRTSVRAGSDDYDLVVSSLERSLETLLVDGILLDLKQIPYVNLEKPWWDQLAVEQLSINNQLFATSSDLTVRDKDATIIFMFSKTLAQNYELGNLYELVNEGKWTFDRMFDMMKIVTQDLNSDGVINDEDQVGLLTQHLHGVMMFNAAGETLARLNADKAPELTIYNPRAIAVSEKIREIQADKNYALNADEYSSKYSDVWDGLQIPMFAEDRALFYHAGMNRVTLLRTMETDFGILPPPKFDEAQTNYHVTVDPFCTSGVAIPATANQETAGMILEALSYESRYTLLPAYYDINLRTKFTRDEESKEMIDLILSNRLYDLGCVYRWSNIVTIFENIAAGQNTTLTTFFEKNESRILSAMDKTIEKLDALK